MTELALPDIVGLVDDTTKETCVGIDLFVGFGSGTWGGFDQSVRRLNNKLEMIWSYHYFRRDAAAFRCWASQCALTRDNQYLYVAGQSDDYDYNLKKLNADDGTIVWEVENGVIGFQLLILDPSENIIVHGSNTVGGDEVLKKYNPEGALQWAVALANVSDIACDANGDIYVTVSGAPGLRKYDGGGNYLGGTSDAGDVLYGVAVDSNNDIIAVGMTKTIGGNDRHVFKFDTTLTLIDSATPTGGAGGTIAHTLCCDSIGEVFVASDTVFTSYLDKFDSSLVSQWNASAPIGDEDFSDGVLLACDVQNRLHLLKKADVEHPGYVIRANSDGAILRESNRFMARALRYGLVCSRDVYEVDHTDRDNMNQHRPDMCCFLPDTIDEFKQYGPPGIPPGDPYGIGAIVTCDVDSIFWDSVHHIHQPELITGVFEVVEDVDDLSLWPGAHAAYKRLTQTPCCKNANWDQYDGLGGIGRSPQVYTVTFADMLNVADSLPSDLNGEYLLIRGPGIRGFFFRYEHATKLRINFTIQDRYFAADWDGSGDWLLGDDKEKLHVDIESVGSVFKYESAGVSVHDEKLTAVANANLIDTEGAIVYGGTASMYPGRIGQWDAIAVWPVDCIVAWKGRFYKALNPNSNSEPPSADWALV